MDDIERKLWADVYAAELARIGDVGYHGDGIARREAGCAVAALRDAAKRDAPEPSSAELCETTKAKAGMCATSGCGQARWPGSYHCSDHAARAASDKCIYPGCLRARSPKSNCCTDHLPPADAMGKRNRCGLCGLDGSAMSESEKDDHTRFCETVPTSARVALNAATLSPAPKPWPDCIRCNPDCVHTASRYAWINCPACDPKLRGKPPGVAIG